MRFFRRMSQSPCFTGLSARLLSHSGGREVEDELENKASRPCGGRFHGACCPIQPQRLDEPAPVPEDAAHEGHEAREAQAPSRQVGKVPEQEVGEKPGPDLPLHGVLAVPDEVVDLAGLLELLEERLDPPPVAVDLRDGAGRPPEAVREELHRLHPPLHLDHGRDAPEGSPVLAGGGLPLGHDDLVREDLRRPLRSRQDGVHEPPRDPHPHVALLPGDEPDAARVEAVHEAEVGVGPVGDRDVPRPEVRGQLGGAHGVVVRGVLHDGEGGEPVAEVERQVELGGRLLSPVPRPVEAVHGEPDRGRVHGEHRGLDPEAVAPVRPLAELRGDADQVAEGLPVEVLRHRGGAHRVRVGERVAPRHGHAHRRPERLVRPRDVADGVERLGLRDLAVEHRRDVALRRERAAQDPVGLRGLGDELVRYGVDNLTDDWVYCLRCFRGRLFHIRVGYPKPPRKATLNRILQFTNGMLVYQNIKEYGRSHKHNRQTCFCRESLSGS